jgi:hypothetical protein
VVGHGSNLITDYERSAIIEATHMVDGYYSWMTTEFELSSNITFYNIVENGVKHHQTILHYFRIL